MIEAFHSAGLGLAACQQRLDVQSQNIANVNTAGYKPQETDFSDALYSAYALSGGGQLTVGTGVRPAGTVAYAEEGAPEKTGRALDLMIKGDGYFCIQGEDGGLSYTRAGNFSSSEDGWLTSADGGYVLNGNLQRISVENTENRNSPEANANGLMAEIGVFTFNNDSGLIRKGGSLLGVSASSGPAMRTSNAEIYQGYLERSAVDLAKEMSKMIHAQRGFQANARMIQSADEIEETANQLQA